MITLTSVDNIDAPADRVWHFLTHLHEGDAYLKWHPVDHIEWTQLKGNGETVGSTYYFAEMIGNKKFAARFSLNKAEPLRYLDYGAAGILGWLHLASATFALKPVGKNKTELTAKVHIGYKLPVIDWLVPFVVNPTAIAKHMREEGYNLNVALTKK